jgi:biopolymer transport protein ExbB/TolQ
MANLILIFLLVCAGLIIAGVALLIFLILQNRRIDKLADKTRKLAEAAELNVRDEESQERK